MNNCINSSKVYCKLSSFSFLSISLAVLIVAKCIVNQGTEISTAEATRVLIVAKCIVNVRVLKKLIEIFSINSSKVYCKSF